jgi:hypothetical protein
LAKGGGGRYVSLPAESGLKHLFSGFYSVKQVFINKLNAERRGKRSTYTGRLSYENNVSFTDKTALNKNPDVV